MMVKDREILMCRFWHAIIISGFLCFSAMAETSSVNQNIADINACLAEVSKMSTEGISQSDLKLSLGECLLGKKKKYICNNGTVVYIDPESDDDTVLCGGCGKDGCDDCCNKMFHWLDNYQRRAKCGNECRLSAQKADLGAIY